MLHQAFFLTSTPLGNAEVFTSQVFDFHPGWNIKEAVAFAVSSHASAASGFVVQVSNDLTNWHNVATSALVANTPNLLTATVVGRYMRVRLTNGATPQTTLFVSIALRKALS